MWSGDVDLNDRKPHMLYQSLQSKLKFIEGIGLVEESMLQRDLEYVVKNITDDLEFCLKSE